MFSAVTAIIILVIVTAAPYLYGIDDDAETPLRANTEVTGHIMCLVTSFTPPDVSYVFDIKANYQKAEAVLSEHKAFKSWMNRMTLPTVDVVLTSLGKYYVTGYTALECNNNTTASGTVCHKAASYEDSFTNPTTCAADVWGGYHEFGDILFIENFGCYIVEDTGSAVKQKHIDLYFWDDEYSTALAITGYYEVFAVEYVYGEIPATYYDIQDMTAEKVTGWKFKEV